MQIFNIKSVITAYPNKYGKFVVNTSWNIMNSGKCVFLLRD
jgi:hypothetical protein